MAATAKAGVAEESASGSEKGGRRVSQEGKEARGEGWAGLGRSAREGGGCSASAKRGGEGRGGWGPTSRPVPPGKREPSCSLPVAPIVRASRCLARSSSFPREGSCSPSGPPPPPPRTAVLWPSRVGAASLIITLGQQEVPSSRSRREEALQRAAKVESAGRACNSHIKRRGKAT